MAANYRASGIGWSNGPIAGGNGRILALPSDDLLLLGSEHWHHDEAVRAGKRVLFRGMARPGFRPAELGWDVRLYVNEITRDAVRVSEPITDFVGWNELNLRPERGDQESDFGDLTRLYTILGGFTWGVLTELRKRPVTKNARLHFGAWAPKDETDYTDHWRAAAELADVMDVHAYGNGAGIVGHIDKYRSLFPGKPVELTEWHSDFDGPEVDRDTLEMLANHGAVHQDFRAYYFLYRWFDPPAHQRALAEAIAVEGSPERYDLFMNPPTVAEPEEPEMPTYRVPAWTPAYEDIRDGAIQVADEYGIPRRRLLGLCLAESGFGLQSFDRWASIERSARMVAAINQSDWSRVEAIFSEISGRTNDISFGPCHQSWWWSLSYEEQQAHPEWQWDLTRIMEFRAHLIEDHGAALRLAAGKVSGGGSDLDVLCLYNKPSTPPAANPNRPNYERSLAEADRILAGLYPQEPTDPVEPTSTQYEAYPDPQPAGQLAACAGVILHGSRSGRTGNPLANEGRGTASYEVNNTLGLGWNATAWPGHVAIHLPADQWGWNARNASDNYVAIEIAQPVESDPIGNVHIAVADYIFDHVWPRWGEVWHFPSHAEIEDWGETGANDGKTDLYHTGAAEMNAFRDKVYARLNERKAGSQPKPEPTPPDYATLTALAYKEDGVVVPALAAALANPDDANLRIQTDSVLRWLRENAPKTA